MRNKEYIKCHFSYNKDGTITRLSNGRVTGSPDSKGYLQCHFIDGTALVHNIVWFMHGREKPEGMMIDHINHNRKDNRIENLRLVTNAGNQKNQSIRPSSLSGFTGVGWHKASGKWAAKIKVSGKDIHLGTYSDMNEAIKARQEANLKYGFHDNHGK